MRFAKGPDAIGRRAGPSVTQADLEDLRAKYERMLALREQHDRARIDPTFIEPDPRDEMARLAERYPGALREIDRLPLAAIVARIAALEEADPEAAAPWMIAQVAFHRLARGALAVKRCLGAEKIITPALREAFERLARDNDEAGAFAGDLEAVARPAGGRLMNLVYAKLAATLALSAPEVRRLLWS